MFTFSTLKENYFVLADIKKPWFDIFNFKSKRIVTSKRPNALYEDREDYNNYLKRAYELEPTFEKTDIYIEKSINTSFELIENKFLKNSLGSFTYSQKLYSKNLF